MNIKITHNWLKEYIETAATPTDIQKYLSLCGPSIERVDRISDDFVYEVEVTSNRIDAASVIGVAREAAAILPRHRIKAQFKKNRYGTPSLRENTLNLTIVDDEKLTNRILAVILDNVHMGQSPAYIRERLEAVGIRSLNNLVDVTNYVMVEIGHPTHVFDYDRVKTGKFVFRTAKKGEKLVTLDRKSFTLKGGEVVIDDGTGRIVDLPSIMGTENSVVTEETKRAIFFIDNLDPVLIRKASMTHGIRTLASTYNEKSPDPELGKSALLRGLHLFHEVAKPASISNIIDIYTKPPRANKIIVTQHFINSRIGVSLTVSESVSILKSLGFQVAVKHDSLEIIPPSFRSHDVQIPEDITEEVARIYGYYRLPGKVQSTTYVKQPKDIGQFLALQSKIKHYLKDIGLHEQMNYSMISKKLIEMADLTLDEHLILKNAISEDLKYMRTHLLPSLLMNIKQNEGKREVLKFFEIAKTYKKKTDDLPEEKYKLGIVVNTSLSDLKGIVDALLAELHIDDFQVIPSTLDFLAKQSQAELFVEGQNIGKYGELSPQHNLRYDIKSGVYAAIFDFGSLMKAARHLAKYKPINPYSEIKLDLTYTSTPKLTFSRIKNIAFDSSPLLHKIDLVSVFKNKVSLRFYFSSKERNITEEEAIKELTKIKDKITIFSTPGVENLSREWEKVKVLG